MRHEFTSADALTYLDVPVAQQSRADVRRINELIKKRLGARAKQKQVYRDGHRFYVWQIVDAKSIEKLSTVTTDF